MSRTVSTTWLITFLVLILLSLFNLPIQAAPSRLVWEGNGHSYQRIENAVTWLEAKRYCESQGGYLATITSKEENEFIFSRISGSHTLWMGGTDAGHEGRWTWVSNESWIYSNWDTGEPNNYNGNEHYLQMVPSGKWNDQSEKSWYDTNLYNKLWFVCEWESMNSFGNLTPYKISNWSDKIVVSNTAGVTTDSSTLYPSDTLYVSFAVINDGTVPITGPFSVDLFVDNNKVQTFADWGLPSLDAGWYIYYRSWSIGSLTTGQHTIRIVADSTDVIAESNETDNQYSKVITVLGSPSSTDGSVTTLITHYYQSIMERGPDAGGLSYWQGLVTERQARGEDVKDVFRQMADFFFNSPEYIGRNTTDRQFITNLYLTFFQRRPDNSGYTFWLDQLARGMTRNQAMSGFLYSPEFTDFMERTLNTVDEVLTVVRNDNPRLYEPNLIIANPYGSVQYWGENNGEIPEQALYASTSGHERVRTFIDVNTGAPRKIVNELTGEYVVVEEKDNDRFDMLLYDAANRYQAGFAIFSQNGEYFVGQIAGTPAFSGQLVGQLNNAGNTGSFTLVTAENSDLINIQRMPEEFRQLMDTLDLNGFRAFGLMSVTPQFIDTNKWRKMAMVVFGAGVISGNPALILAGGGAFVASEIWDWAKGRLYDKVGVNELLKIAGNNAGEWGSMLIGAANASEISYESPGQYQGTIDSKVTPDMEPKPSNRPPPASTGINGEAAQQNGSRYNISGKIDPDGKFSVSGSEANGRGSINIGGRVDPDTGKVSGQFSDSKGGSGSIEGQQQAIGECQVTQTSGGQGTFSNTHFIGTGGGTLAFEYETYTNPDALTVSAGSSILFTTGGRVSGYRAVSLTVPKDVSLVFVSVTAPGVGTEWNYSIGCVQ